MLNKAPITDPIIAGYASTASPAGTTSSPSRRQAKFTIRLDPDLLGRIRAAYLADLATGSGTSTLSAWAADALEEAVASAEQRHGSTRFTPVGTGRVPRLPLGEHQ